jgi:dihydrodipicolinate synthase/N-acetylneuraminate lyase
MVMDSIKGIVMPMITPFLEDGEVDQRLGCEIADFLIGARVHALFLLGSFGQGPVMRLDQRTKYAETIVRHVRGRIPVIVHVGTADVYSTVDLGRHAMSIGCDAIAVVGPYYYSDHTEYEIIEHYREVADQVRMPMMIYNNPPYSGYDMSPSMMLKIREKAPQVFATKLSVDRLETALMYLSQLPKDFFVFGLASSLMPGVIYGVKGTIVPPMLAFPELVVSLWDALERKDMGEAVRLQMQWNNLQRTLQRVRAYGRVVERETLRLRGFNIKRFPRWKTKAVPEDDIRGLAGIMKEAGVPVVNF